jgi:hypothetical protein
MQACCSIAKWDTFILLHIAAHIRQVALREGGPEQPATQQKRAVEVADPSSELCGIWAYIKWENDGCPNRSAQESDAEYQVSIRVLGSNCSADVCCNMLLYGRRSPDIMPLPLFGKSSCAHTLA